MSLWYLLPGSQTPKSTSHGRPRFTSLRAYFTARRRLYLRIPENEILDESEGSLLPQLPGTVQSDHQIHNSFESEP